MTAVELTKQNGSIVSFTVKGHSGYAESGYDIVCAALSSVIWMTVNGLENILGLDISYTEKDGFIKCVLPPLPADERKKADILLDSLSEFIDSLVMQYGKYVTKTEV